VGVHEFDGLAEFVVHGFGRFGFQDQGVTRSKLRDRVPKLSVVVVVVSVIPLGCVTTLVEDVCVCAKATEPIRAVAKATLTIDLIIETNFLVY